jgi:hypothetical protein
MFPGTLSPNLCSISVTAQSIKTKKIKNMDEIERGCKMKRINNRGAKM